MPKWFWYVCGAVLGLAALAAWWVRTPRPDVLSSDLLARFPAADKRSALPLDRAFSLIDASVAGVTMPAIFTPAQGRVTWHEVIPPRAWLETSVALREESWTHRGDGVQFSIGIADGRDYDVVFSTLLNPFGQPADRRWVHATIDLSAYAGEAVDIVFHADPGPPGDNDTLNDFALFGAPRIVIR